MRGLSRILGIGGICILCCFTYFTLDSILRQTEVEEKGVALNNRDQLQAMVADIIIHEIQKLNANETHKRILLDKLNAGSDEKLDTLIQNILQQIPRKSGDQLLPSCSSERHNFVYLKNHKCASDTLSNVHRRFGYSRNLSLVQPRDKKWNIGWPKLLQPYYYRTSKSGVYNILTEHTVLDEKYLDLLMEPKTVYITSIREPFSHLKSSFNFFNVPKLGHINEALQPGEDALMFFLKDKERIDKQYQDPNTYKSRPCVPAYLSVVRNMMAFNLGLPVGFHDKQDKQDDLPYIKSWLKHIDEKFETVMLVEYFHESLVMLKRMMCWNLKDIVYLRVNTRRVKNVTVKYPPELIDSYLRWTLPDTLLYAHFNRTFWERIHVMGTEDFMAEVQDYDQFLTKTMEFCDNVKHGHNVDEYLTFPATKWNPLIMVTVQDCNLITSPSGVREELRQRYDSDPRPVVQPSEKVYGC